MRRNSNRSHELPHWWWLHQMKTFSALLAFCAGNSPVTGEFASQTPVTRSFDFFFDLRLNKRSSKQSWRRWFETPSHSLWRHCNICVMSGGANLPDILKMDTVGSRYIAVQYQTILDTKHDISTGNAFILKILSAKYLVSTQGEKLGRTLDSQNFTLQWRHNGCDGISNHRRLDCLLIRLFGHRSKKRSKLRVTGLCEGNPPVTSGFSLRN